jgi:hypothetical protein
MALLAITSPPRFSPPGCGQVSERIRLSTGSGKAQTGNGNALFSEACSLLSQDRVCSLNSRRDGVMDDLIEDFWIGESLVP